MVAPGNLISNDLDIYIDLETQYVTFKFPSRICTDKLCIGLHMVIIKFHEVLIENDLQLDINAKLDLESQNKNQK